MARKIQVILSLALAATGTLPAATYGVSGKAFAAEAADAFAFQTVDFMAAGAVAALGVYYEGLFYGATAVLIGYPFAAALGCDVGAGTAGERATNRAEAIAAATVAAYAETVFLGGVVIVLEATHRDVEDVYMNDIYLGILLFDVVSKPFLVTYVYNATKKPAAPPGSRLAVGPYVCAAAAADGAPLPLYGVTISF